MQINIGAKIKELRKRNGKTQDNMANALGVTPQAISRWEANGGYPDIEILPVIANYFHINIDELFGYSKDREKIIGDIISKADAAINAQEDMAECIKLLRNAIEEFPTESQLFVKLGYALIQQGWKKYGARSYTKDGSDYAFVDAEYNKENIYWQEAMSIFETVLDMNVSCDDREAIILLMIVTYQNMGYVDKAVALAEKQNSLIMSKELLLPKATESELRDRYQGEAIISLLVELKNVMLTSIQTKVSVFSSNKGVNLIVSFAKFLETIFSDGNCGIIHYHLCELYLYSAMYEAIYRKSYESALEYFDKGYDYKKKYEGIKNKGEYHYTDLLVSKVTFQSSNFPAINPDFWKIWKTLLPNEFVNTVRANSKYSECFADENYE